MNILDLDMPFVRDAFEAESVRHMHEILHMDILSESNVVDLSLCWMPCPSSSFSLMREVETWGRDLHLKA